MKKMTNTKKIALGLSVLALVSLSACQKSAKDSEKNSGLTENHSTLDTSSSSKSGKVDESIIEDQSITIDLTPINLPDMTGVDYANPSDKVKAILNSYENLYQSLDNFKNFVNKRSDLQENEKVQIIAKRARYMEFNNQLKEKFSKLLTQKEMKNYETLIVPSYGNGGPGQVKEDDELESKIKNIEAQNPELTQLQSKLEEVEAGNLLAFEQKVQKEKSKLLGF